MMEPEDVSRLQRHLRTFGEKADDAEGLGQLYARYRELDQIIGQRARALNARGITWRQLASAMGIPHSTAHFRYARG